MPLAEAGGAILAHAVDAADPRRPEGPTYRIPKGTRLGADHLRDLAANDVVRVVVARLGPDDVPEDAAAARLAAAVAGPGLEVGPAANGRANLHAAHAGIAVVDAAAIHAANLVDPALTLATVPPWQRMAPGGLVATLKIIPFAVDGGALAEACAIAAGALSLRAPQLASATLVETARDGTPPPDKGRRSTAARLTRLGLPLSDRVVVPHEAGAVAAALRAAPGELLLILTASATSDAHDVAPEGLRAAGGRVIRYGMPVDPGNLLFLGTLGARPVIGLPGCARSPALNGADWVLERVACGVPVTGADIAAMGVGGLLKEIPSRPRPREG